MVKPSALLAAITISALCILTGCGSVEANEANSATEASEGSIALGSLSAVELAALTDKSVDSAELQRAAAVITECITGLGFKVVIDGVANRPSDVGVEFPSTTAEIGDNNQSKVDACFAKVNAIEDVWILQNQASDETIKASHQVFVNCLLSAGLDVSTDMDFDKAVEIYGKAASQMGPESADLVPLQACASNLSEAVGTMALPGLAEALAALES